MSPNSDGITFDQAYPALYQGWDKASAQADFNATGGKNKAGYASLLGSSNTNSSPSSSSSAPASDSSFSPTNFLNDMMGKLGDTINNQTSAMTTRYNQDTQRIKDAINTAQTNASNKYQLPQLESMTNALNSRIQDLSGNLSGYGAGGYASSDQVDKAINSKYLPQFNTAESNLERGATLANQEVAQEVTPLTDEIARENAGYSQENQAELDGLLQAYSTGASLTNEQLNRINQLATAEDQYNATIQSAQISNQYREIPYLGGLYDTTTNSEVGGGSGGGGLSYNTTPSGSTDITPPTYFTPDTNPTFGPGY